MTEKRYVRILDYYEKEVRIFDEHNQKNIFNIFFEGLDSAICLNGALEDTVDLLNYFYDEKKNLKEENEQLKQRNDRQAKQLDRLYHLIEEKDWRTLTDIFDDFKRCEEQLQREWRTYK